MVRFYIEKIKPYLLKVPWFKCIIVLILMIISSNISYIAKYYPQNLEYQAIYYDSYEETETLNTSMPRASQEAVVNYCKIYGVDERLAFAVIEVQSHGNPDYISTDRLRYGYFGVHIDHLERFRRIFPNVELDYRMSAYSNIMYGVYRLKEVTDNNESLEGALMVFELGGKEAMRLWAQGVKTTEFVEKVKEQMDE